MFRFGSIIIIGLLSFIGGYLYSGDGSSEFKNFPKLTGDYLGQKQPGRIPQLFARGIISTDAHEGCSGWGNQMEYFIFQRRGSHPSRLYIMIRDSNDVWSSPIQLPFGEKYKVGDFTIGPDGKTMVFASKRFIPAIGSDGEGANIWITKKEGNGWTKPKPVEGPINTKYHDSYPALASNGNLYFFSRKPGGFGKSDLYLSEFRGGAYQQPVNLGKQLNTAAHEWDTYIAPDESYVIYCSMMAGSFGGDDLYISFKGKNGEWGNPIHFDSTINSDKSENRPYVSPDGKFLFYASTKRGRRDIYWVSTEIFKQYRK